jgi:predicted dehydrogenase
MGSAYDHLAGPMAKKSRRKFDVEDLAAGMVKFSNGATLEVEASWASNIGENELMETRLLGTKGGLVQRNVGGGYDFEGRLYLDRGGRIEEIATKPVPHRLGGPMHHFIECLATGKTPISTGEQGATVMQVLDAIYASAECDAPVRIR